MFAKLDIEILTSVSKSVENDQEVYDIAKIISF